MILATTGTDSETLLERSDELALLGSALADANATGRGRLVVVSGEAGIGKTALAHVFCAGLGSTRVLAGACEALNTPRPLGPLLDIAADSGGELAEVVEAVCATPSAVLAALLDELRRRKPSVVVLEDLHWADEATLDLLKLMGRRVARVAALVLVTSRDELDRRHPLRVVLGELPRESVQRVLLRPLSPDAVATLAAARSGRPRTARRRGDRAAARGALAARVACRRQGGQAGAVHRRGDAAGGT